MKIEFSTYKYERDHIGEKMPRGYGYWGFECEGHELWAYGTLTEAKKKVREQIKEIAPKDYKGVVTCYILP